MLMLSECSLQWWLHARINTLAHSKAMGQVQQQAHSTCHSCESQQRCKITLLCGKHCFHSCANQNNSAAVGQPHAVWVAAAG